MTVLSTVARTLRSSTFAALPLIGLLGGAAHAADVTTTTSRMVQTGDLDLHTQSGTAALRHRIEVAARAVCGEPALFGTPGGNDYNGCVSRAEQGSLAIAATMVAAVRTDGRLALADPAR